MAQRLEALKRIKITPWPSGIDETWRRTDPRLFSKEKFALASDGLSVAFDPPAEYPFQCGSFGSQKAPWDESVMQAIVEVPEDTDSPGIGLLQVAFWQNGAYFLTDDHRQHSHIVQIKVNSDLPLGGAHLPLVVIRIGKRSRMKILLELNARSRGVSLFASQTRIVLDEGARLDLMLMSDCDSEVRFYDHLNARLGRESELRLTWGDFTRGTTVSRREALLTGPGAEATMRGGHIGGETSHLDLRTLQLHTAEVTTSNLLYKAALFGQAKSVYQGLINVAPTAQMANAYQLNRNLLMSEGARADSIPKLEILVDEVRCTHGATAGKVDPEALFYLMSRGLGEAEATHLLLDGFISEIVSGEVPTDFGVYFRGRMQERLKKAMEARL